MLPAYTTNAMVIKLGTCFGQQVPERREMVVGKSIKCEDCGRTFKKTNKSNRCPECRKIQLRYDYQAPEKALRRKEEERGAREKKLIDAAKKANKRGMSYGQLQAEKTRQKVKCSRIPEGYTSYKERRKKMGVSKEEVAPVQEETEKKISVSYSPLIRGNIMTRIAEITTTIDELTKGIEDLERERTELTTFLEEYK